MDLRKVYGTVSLKILFYKYNIMVSEDQPIR